MAGSFNFCYINLGIYLDKRFLHFLLRNIVSIRCIIGLGNPGREYEETRHNIGFIIAAELAKRAGVKIRPGKGSYYLGRANIKGKSVMLALPTTYMNRSGIAVKQVLENEELAPEEILIVMDDFELPFGQLRIRKTGSGGSHNGMSDIVERLDDQNIPRLRIGIGNPPERMDPADYVLSRFSPSERKELPDIVISAVLAIETAILDGIDAAMNEFNRKTTGD